MENYTKYRLKPEQELIRILADLDRIFVISCNKCFKEFDKLQEPECDMFAELVKGQGKTVTGVARLDFLCNKTLTAKLLAELIPEHTETVAVISCGLGIQTVADLTALPVVAVCDSVNYTGHHGMALTKKACDACAQCYLNITGGICPVVDCSKSLLNGQCGGAKNGKCEINPEKDCAWQKIQERLESQGRLEELKYQPVQLRDFSKVNTKVINDYVKAIRAERFEGFYGGVHPTERVGLTEHLPLVRFPEPDTVVIPLSMHTGAPSKPVVRVGDTVKVGQLIGEADGGLSLPIHASVSGKVTAIEVHPHAILGSCMSIVIASDGKNELHESVKPGKTLEQMTASEIVDAIKNAGIAGMGGAAFPTHIKLTPGKPIDTVLLNGCECEPLLTADHRTLLEYTDEIIYGLKVMMKALDAPRGIIVIEDNKPDAVRLVENRLAEEPALAVLATKTKYPQGSEKMLIKRALGRIVPRDGLPADVGTVVCNVSTAKAIADTIKTGMPLIERVITVTGDYIAKPGNFIAKIGTSVADLVEYCGGITAKDQMDPCAKEWNDSVLVKAGGPMMGVLQETLKTPVMKGSNGIVVVKNDQLEPQECIKCGRCVDVCPMELKPLYFAKYAGMDKFHLLKDYNVMDCVECGCCAYICSSKIPLVDLIKIGKQAAKGMN